MRRLIAALVILLSLGSSAWAQCSLSNLSACPSPPFNAITANSITAGVGTFGAITGPIGSVSPSSGAFSSLNVNGSVLFSGLSIGAQVSCLGLNSSNQVVLSTPGCGTGSGGSLTITDGANTVTGVTGLTVSGGTVGGTTPNATLTITGGSGITQLTGGVTAGPGSGSQVATLVLTAGSGVTGILGGVNGGTGVNNGSNTITTSLPLHITGSGTQTLFFGNTGVPWTYNFPQVTANLGYQVGSIVSGDCLQASSTAGGFSDAGAVCGSGGSGITQLTGGVTAGPGSGSQAATLVLTAGSGVTGILSGVNGGTGVANTGKTLTLGGSLSTTGAATPVLAFGASTFTYTFPGATSNLDYQVGSFTNGHCLQASGTAGGIADSGSACGSGGSVSLTTATPDLVFTPSPITGTGTIGTTIPLNTQTGASYAILTTDNTSLIEMTNASATTMTIPVANSTGFLSGWGASIVATLAATTITPASGTICGLSSVSLQPGQFLSIGAGASTDYACALGLPASVPSGTIASGKNLGFDSSNRLVTATVSGASGANPTATASDTAVNGSATTFMRSDAAPAVQKTSSSLFGLAKVDNQTIIAASGVISTTVPIRTVTTSPTVLAADMGGQIISNVSGGGTITVPAISGTVFAGGMSLVIVNYSASTAAVSTTPTINAGGGCVSGTGIPTGDTWLMTSNGTTIDCVQTVSAGGSTTFANPTATAGPTAVNGTATTAMRSDGAPAVQKGTNAQFGIVEGDGTTITCVAGVCTSVGGAATTITPGTTTIVGATAPCFIQNSTSTTMACVAGTSSVAAAPQGRLTLTTGTPVMTADATAQTTVYYDTYQGNLYPNWSGSAMANITITGDEISMGLDAVTPHIASGSVYDIYGTSGAAICAGPAWSSTTTRGTGAGTTQLALKSGVWTNAVSLTHCWGGASGTTDLGAVAANQGTYLGTIYATANGQTGVAFKPAAASGGANPIVGLFNAYNRVPASSRSLDNHTSWTYQTATWRAADASNSNRVSWVDGLGVATIRATYTIIGSGVASQADALSGVDFDSTSAVPDAAAYYNASYGSTNSIIEVSDPLLGFHFAQAVERSNVVIAAFTWSGVISSTPAAILLVSYVY